MADDPDDPAIERAKAGVLALAAAIGRYMAAQVHHNLQKHPDIVDGDDPRLLEPLPSSAAPSEPQWVYFMADSHTGFIKIGTTINMKVRLRTVRREFGRQVTMAGHVSGGYATETALHRLLSDHHAHGEWFKRGPWFDKILAGLDAREDAEALLARLTANGGRDG